MTQPERRWIIPSEAVLQGYEPMVIQNSRNELYFNPRAMAALDSTTAYPTDALGFAWLSEKELEVRFVDPDADMAVPFRRSNNRRTGCCGFGTVLVLMPLLRTQKGRQTLYPYRVDTLKGGTKRFVLLIGSPKLVPVVGRRRRASVKTV